MSQRIVMDPQQFGRAAFPLDSSAGFFQRGLNMVYHGLIEGRKCLWGFRHELPRSGCLPVIELIKYDWFRKVRRPHSDQDAFNNIL